MTSHRAGGESGVIMTPAGCESPTARSSPEMPAATANVTVIMLAERIDQRVYAS
jgi:hypothetical protein